MPEEAQDGDHHEIADGEPVAFEPLLVAEPIRDALELQLSEILGPGTTELRPFLALIEDIDEEQVEDCRLDAVEGSISPLDCTKLSLLVPGKKRVALFTDILDDRAALEDPDLSIVEARHLIERLFLQIF